MKIGIGIDTGGTCTDAVIYDFDDRKVLAHAKSLTTKEDLTIGILNSLNQLPIELVKKATHVSLSTTLATNACVEGKGGRAKLILYGADEEYVFRVGASNGDFSKEDLYCIETNTTYDGKIKKIPDWDQLEADLERECKDCEAMAVAEIFSRQTGAVLEREAKSRIEKVLDIPVVCGYELFDDLDFIRRGTSALLNARLVPLIDVFLKAVDFSLKDKNLELSPVIVRSDGTLMSREFAKFRPVETLLCGPVASAMGACELAQVDEDAVIVDMGGTTTDVAFIRDKRPARAEGGILIGEWKTFVKGLYVETFGLGGDTAIHYKDWKPYLEDGRVMPLCILASDYPSVLEELKELDESNITYTRWIHEYFIIQKELTGSYTDEEKAIALALKEGPLSMKKLAQAIGVQVYDLNTERLEKEGVILRCGLTPTDIMHIKGDYTRYCTEASVHAVNFMSRCVGMEPEEFMDWVYQEVKHTMYTHLAKILLKRQFPILAKEGVGSQIELLIEENWKQANGKSESKEINFPFKVPGVFIGVGGPIGIFLPDVAKAFGSHAIIPDHAEVANAVGAVVSNVAFEVRVKVHVCYNSYAVDHFMVYRQGESKFFGVDYREDACAYAKAMALEDAKTEVLRRGIGEEVTLVESSYKEYFAGKELDNIVFMVSVTQK
ncbi:N-methylhydantoinase (ATP-hydrolyzing) [Lachnospiraceae bacterium TWA4]|nr:N-methylhydantoinase (ATP-hydrolyzing) [Lachnospiraceae bacterium TWA4]